jgi:ferritin-like metal-binding protein YciE
MDEKNQYISTLKDLLDYQVLGFTIAEVQLAERMQEWIVLASSLQLKSALQRYIEFIKQHLQNSGVSFAVEKLSPFGNANRVMKAFIAEMQEKLELCNDSEVRDACLLANIQAINHYKISTYGTATAFAHVLGMEKEASVFHEAGINEKQIDALLSQLAEYGINKKARAPIALTANQ